jgi:thiol-disulfide isomerase/thioredoxin
MPICYSLVKGNRRMKITKQAAFFALSVAGLAALLAKANINARAALTHGGEQSPYVLDVPAPELVGGPWVNTPKNVSVKLAGRKGKVTVVEFWTFGCINCRHNLPIYARWQKRFEKQDVVILGVHTPETDEEKVAGNVIRKVKSLGITYPVLLDQNGANWNRWSQQYWPTVYLIDKKGRVRYRWEGELEYEKVGGEEKMAQRIEMLLKEKE